MNFSKNIIVLMIFTIPFFLGISGMTKEIQNAIPQNPLTIKELPEFRITKGKVLYSRYCSFCHGEEGAGDGLNAYSIEVKPRNFNDQIMKAQKTNIELGKVILKGGASQGLSKFMPAFDKTLSARQVKYLIGFIRRIQKDNNE